MRTGFLGKLVLQEEWQELTSPLLPQHKALSSPEPPAHAGSRRALPALHKASSAHAQGYIILQRRQLNSTAIYLWFPHDASGSAGEQGTDLRRRDKTQRVLKPHQRASPGAARESWGCSAG